MSDRFHVCKLVLIVVSLVGCGLDITFEDENRDLLERYDPDAGSAAPDAALDTGLADLDGLDHAAWGGVLGLHIQAACFDYDGLLASDEGQALLDQYLGQLERVSLPGLGVADRAALWINAYNAITVRGVIAAREDDAAFRVDQDGFAFFQVQRARVGGIFVSLDMIEHVILRGDASHSSISAVDDATRDAALAQHDLIGDFDPRIHFALNCASRSCPNLRFEAYAGDTLEAQLQAQTVEFLDDASKGAGPDGISSLFLWFGGDFTAVAPVDEFIEMHRTQGLDGVELGTYLEYLWSPNDFQDAEPACMDE
jgi:hypothetical protein